MAGVVFSLATRMPPTSAWFPLGLSIGGIILGLALQSLLNVTAVIQDIVDEEHARAGEQ
jgi:hypothetical protein